MLYWVLHIYHVIMLAVYIGYSINVTSHINFYLIFFHLFCLTRSLALFSSATVVLSFVRLYMLDIFEIRMECFIVCFSSHYNHIVSHSDYTIFVVELLTEMAFLCHLNMAVFIVCYDFNAIYQNKRQFRSF